ncbi:MAG: hypothetical protein WAM28_07495, partial [Chlamydiales bacterium]
MSGVDNNRGVDSSLGCSAAKDGSVPPTAAKVNLAFQQNPPRTPEASVSLPPMPPILAAPIVLGGMAAQHCKKNRDAHLGNAGNAAPGEKAINFDRSKMGVLHRLGVVPLKTEKIFFCGKEVEIALYPRMHPTKSQVEIVKGPVELVGLKVDGLNCHESGWQQQAVAKLAAQVNAQQQNAKAIPTTPVKESATSVSTTSTNQPKKFEQVPPQQQTIDLTASPLDFISRGLNTASTTLINMPLIDSIDPTDTTKNAEAKKLLQNIQEAQMRKNKVKADFRATGQENE